jgi:DNA-binding transcriptional MerR regulator
MLEEITSMRVGEVSERTGVSARSLRYYEQRGLLEPCRAANGYREYDELGVVRAAHIRDLMASGLTVDDIRLAIDEGCLDRPLDCRRARAACRWPWTGSRCWTNASVLVELRERLAAQVSQTRLAVQRQQHAEISS